MSSNMSPEPYFFSVSSNPSVSDDLWKEFYISEHLPDVVNSGCATRACFYEEAPTHRNADPETPRKFVALYQTPYPELLKSENHNKIRETSELFAREGSDTNVIMEVGDFNGRNFELIQNFDPLGIGETPSPHILTVEMHPKDVEDLEKWYREEHLLLLQKLPGYRRTLRYKLGPDSENGKGFQADYLAIHEIDDLSGFGGEEAKAANTTPWTLKHIEQSQVFIVRGWNLIHSLGY